MITRRRVRTISVIVHAVFLLWAAGAVDARAQGLGGAGTLQGTVKDPTGGVMISVPVNVSNPVSGFKRSATTDEAGHFIVRNLPPNTYHMEIAAQGFQTLVRDVEIASPVPIDLDLTLLLAGATAGVEVVGHTELLERTPTAHTDVDQTLVDKLLLESSSGLNQIVTLASPGVVADSNGFFHPMGDHAQTQFSIDNQPVTDQQSRLYSNQISQDAVESMEVINGVPPAEFGDKDSLVVRITTKSGLDHPKPFGTVTFGLGSFSTPTVAANLGVGGRGVGNFLTVSGMRTDRFLDPPEFEALHDHGDSQSVFDRFDAHPNDNDSFHLNLQYGRSTFDVPNTYDADAIGQAQHQKVTTLNFAPGYSRVLSSSMLLTANAFVRQDHLIYTPSPDPFADQPGTAGQDRKLTNTGVKVDLAYSRGAHNVKFGGSISGTKLEEEFSLGLTDPELNSPLSPDFAPGLVPFDLTRRGHLFEFNGSATIKQQAFYIQDEIKAGNATFNLGLRADRYDGLSQKSLAQPRLGVSFAVPGSGTIVRASYGRTLETPYNENLVLASSADGAVFGSDGVPLEAGVRDQVDFGFQQQLGRWVQADLSVFHKHTTNAYDFGNVFETPIFFPISWDHSDLDGVAARLSLVQHGGFSAFVVMGHTHAKFCPPAIGGFLLEEAEDCFLIDHDQKFQQTTNLQYQYPGAIAPWVALTWRYDSGLVAGSVPDYDTALSLTAAQQAAIGLFCGSTVATRDEPIESCSADDRGAKRLVIPADGEEDDLTNPPRIAPRHLFDLGFGVDNLLGTDQAKVRLRFSVLNVTNRQTLYNFLSTFSGTHFVTPRSYQAQLGVTF